MPVIGVLDISSPAGAERRVRGFREGLKKSGYFEVENVAIVRRWAEGETDQLPALATDLTRQRVAVLATIGNATALAAKPATMTVPHSLPWAKTRSGLVLSRAWPGPVAT
jgi:putative tryptophan/tyrosine transport system substrate-binding protein